MALRLAGCLNTVTVGGEARIFHRNFGHTNAGTGSVNQPVQLGAEPLREVK